MRRHIWILTLAAIATWPVFCHAENQAKVVRKAIERSTLDQAGMSSFHLKAVLAPSFERDKESGRTGEVEIWWESPTRWRREVRSPEFHQIEIVDGTTDWQKNEGDFFPEWLREIAVELIQPVPPIDDVLEHEKAAEKLQMGPMTNLSWTTTTGTSEVRNIVRTYVAFQGSTGLLLYAGGLGWGGEFKDYSNFHGRMIARTLSNGTPEVTAKVTILEDLGEAPSGFFDASAQGGDSRPLHTVLIDEPALRKNLQTTEPPTWPPLENGPFEGNFTTEVVVDREGKVREVGGPVSENSAINEAGRQFVLSMKFQPYVVNGIPVQAMSQITVPFKATRTPGREAFDSARAYFERGKLASFPAAGTGPAYVVRAEFDGKTRSGSVEKGRYEDTWLNESHWRREAWIGKSHYARARKDNKTYELADGQDSGLLRFVFEIMEPIPETDNLHEGDWRIKRDTFQGASTMRVVTGYESPEGVLDAEQARGYWFDDQSVLVKTFFGGIETHRSEFADFGSVKVAHLVSVVKNGEVAMLIRITEVSPGAPTAARNFEIKGGHDWRRALTSGVR